MSVEKEECELEQLVSSDEEPRVADNAHVTPPITPKPPPRAHSQADNRTKTSSTSNKVSNILNCLTCRHYDLTND